MPIHWMRVLIIDLSSEKKRVNVRMPVMTFITGIKMGARLYHGQAGGDGQIMDAIRNGSIGKILDVIGQDL